MSDTETGSASASAPSQSSLPNMQATSLVQGIAPPKPLVTSGNIVENWKQFKQVWNNYSIITGLSTHTEDYRVALFLHCLGPEALKIYNGMQFANETEQKTLSKIVEKFDEFAIGEVNETYEHHIFNGRNQGQDESIDAYVACLRSLARTCGFCECLADSLLRDRIVLGVKNNNLRKRLLQERKLDLKKCIDICRSSEAASSQLKNISDGTNDNTHDVNRVHDHAKKPQRKTKNDRHPRNDHLKKKTCLFCGKSHPFKKEQCPAWGKRCQKCNGRNHFSSVCKKSGKSRDVHGVTEETESDSHDGRDDSNGDSSDYEFLAVIAVDPSVHAIEERQETSGHAREIYTEMIVNKNKVKFQIDCGASINIINQRYTTGSLIQPSNKTLKMWNGTDLKPLGITCLKVKNPKTGNKYSIEFVVVPDGLTALIGARTAQQMELITVHQDNFVTVPAPQKQLHEDIRKIETADELVRRHADVFSKDLGTLPGTVHLQIDESAKPSNTPSRRVPTALREKFKAELDRLESLEVLAKVDAPTEWLSSVVIATKKSGALRICIDPRPLNQVLKREMHQLPILDDLMPELARGKIFSTVDLTAGYWHCILDHESSLLTTFVTPFGRYRWKRLPFGLSASSEIFQKRVSQALEGLDGILNITDDVLIYGVGDTQEEALADHDRNLEALLQRCKAHGITLNKNKLKLRTPEVPFIGHIFSNEGLKIDPNKAKAVLDMPRPEDAEGVQRLNGFVNYLAKFLPRLADYMEPIRRLTRQDTEFNWTEEQENAFREVKRLVTTAPVLSYYDPKTELEIQCDASPPAKR